jgi:hypothetical protein
MIEFSFAELFLLAWAIFATVVAVFAVQRERAAKHFVRAIMDDENFRNELVSSYKMFKEANE